MRPFPPMKLTVPLYRMLPDSTKKTVDDWIKDAGFLPDQIVEIDPSLDGSSVLLAGYQRTAAGKIISMNSGPSSSRRGPWAMISCRAAMRHFP